MSGVRRDLLGGLLAIFVAGSPLLAQGTSAVDAGVALLRFPLDDRLVLGPWLRGAAAHDAGRLLTSAAGSLVASPGVAATSLEGTAALRGEVARCAAWELAGEASALSATGARTSESVLGGARLLCGIGAHGGVWARGSGHVAWRESGALTGRGVELGGWWRAPRASLGVTLTREWAQGQLFDGPVRTRVLGVVPVRYDEGAFALGTVASWGTLDVTAGARHDPDAIHRIEPLWSVTAAIHRTSRTAIVLGLAHQPDDFIHGADATESASIGLRVGGTRRAIPPATSSRPTLSIVGAEGDATRRLRVHAPSARRVEVMGDFTGWEGVALSGSDGDFALDVALRPGTHRLLVRVDGGDWTVPANLPSVPDDLGGRVGLLAVQ